MSHSLPSRPQPVGVDFEPLLAEESSGDGDNDNHRTVVTGRSSGDAIEHHDEEECSPVGRSFLGPMLGRSNLSALTSCALLAGCTVLHRISYLHHFRVTPRAQEYDEAPVYFDMPELVLKSAVAAVGAAALRRLRIVRPFPGLSWGAVKLWAPVAALYCARLLVGRTLLRPKSLPDSVLLYGIMNPVVAVTYVGEYFCFGSKPERLAVAAVAALFGGAVLVVWKDVNGQVNFALASWFHLGLQWLFSSGLALYLKFATDHIHVSIVGMVFVNSVLCIAIALPVAILNGEASLFLRADYLHTFDYFSTLFFVGLALLFVTCATLNCVAATGPTTYAFLASVVSVALSGGGMSWIYVSATLLGGVLYSGATLRTSIAAGEAGWAGEMVRARFAPLSQDEPVEAEPPSLQLPEQV